MLRNRLRWSMDRIHPQEKKEFSEKENRWLVIPVKFREIPRTVRSWRRCAEDNPGAQVEKNPSPLDIGVSAFGD